MWVITRSINQYDQDGDYFDENLAKHVQNGGGRIDFEGTWYFLTEVKSGEQYVHS